MRFRISDPLYTKLVDEDRIEQLHPPDPPAAAERARELVIRRPEAVHGLDIRPSDLRSGRDDDQLGVLGLVVPDPANRPRRDPHRVMLDTSRISSPSLKSSVPLITK